MAFTHLTLKGAATAGLLALSMSFAPVSAEAKTHVFVGVGVGGGWYGPGYDDCWGGNWGGSYLRCGPGWGYPRYVYSPNYYYPGGYGYYHRPYSYNRISCAAARNMIRNRGYYNVVARDCSGSSYAFGATRNGYRVVVRVSANTGRITSVARI